MQKFFIVILFAALVIAEELNNDENEGKTLARRKRFRFPFQGLFGYGFGFHALAILYWIKVKLIVIAFAVGTAVIWGIRYFWAHKKCPEIDGSIIPYEAGWSSHHPTAYSSHHSGDDIEYSGPDPYSAWSSYSESSPHEVYGSATSFPSSHPSRRVIKSRQFSNEQQISEMVFHFLGVNSEACRKRFLCEVEFKSKPHPLTRLAFRVIGRGIFEKYVRNPKDENSPKSFEQCENAHTDCQFIEDNEKELEHDDEDDQDSEDTVVQEAGSTGNNDINDSAANRQQRRDLIAESILQRPRQSKVQNVD